MENKHKINSADTIELNKKRQLVGSGGKIDFYHTSQPEGTVTSEIEEQEAGTLKIVGNLHVTGGITATGGLPDANRPVGIWDSYVHRTEWNGQIVENHMLRVPVLPELVDACGTTYFDWCMFEASQPNAKNVSEPISGTRYWDAPDVNYSADPDVVPPAGTYGKPVWAYINLPQARKAVRNIGEDFHLTTILEDAIIATWCQRFNLMPHGNNGNVNPPRDSEFTSETAVLDLPGRAKGLSQTTPENWYRCLTGTGPKAWSHTGELKGLYDLNGNIWEWRDGLLMEAGTGYPYVLASLKMPKAKSPYGKAAAVGAGYLADETKQWDPNEFAGCWLHTEIAGTLYEIASNTGTTLNLVNTGTTPVGGNYVIMRRVEVDITAGSTTGKHINSLQTDDALKWFNIPASTVDTNPVSTWGKDGYWFNKDALRGAFRGGLWGIGAAAGVFSLIVYGAPAASWNYFGFRAAKYPDA